MKLEFVILFLLFCIPAASGNPEAQQIEGIVLKENGTPAADAQIVMVRNGEFLRYSEKTFKVVISNSIPPKPWTKVEEKSPVVFKSDSEGKFAITIAPGDEEVIFVHEDETASFPVASIGKTVSLRKPASVIGLYIRSGKGAPDQEIELKSYFGRTSGNWAAEFVTKVRSDPSGRFKAEHLPPGDCCSIFVTSPESKMIGPERWIMLNPGETAVVELGGDGRDVTGELSIYDNKNHAFQDVPETRISGTAKMGEETWFVANDPASGKKRKFSFKFEPYTRPKAKPAIGAPAPELTYITLEGEEQKLSDYKGKWLLVDFWATYCSPCIAEIPNVRKAFDLAAKEDRIRFISLSIDHDIDLPRKHHLRNPVPWTQGYLRPGVEQDAAGEAYLNGIPNIVLISPDGTVEAIELRGEEIARTIKVKVLTP